MTSGKRVWIAAASLLALAAGLRIAHHFSRPPVLHAGDRLVPFALRSLSGEAVTVHPSGRPQVINVFTTWCPVCRLEEPALASLAKTLRARGVEVIGIDQQEAPDQVARFRDQFALGFPLYIDAENLTHTLLGARVIPETVYVSADGVIRWIRQGPLTDGDLRALDRDAGRAV